MQEQNQPKESRTFKKHTYRGVPLEQLKEMPLSKFAELLPSAKRRRFKRGLTQREVNFLRKCAKAKAESGNSYEKPRTVNTHSNTMVIVPALVGNVVGVHNGNSFVPLEIKPEMIGYYLKDFIFTKKIIKHGKAGIGATSGSKFVPLK
ncbi:ribosomal S15 [Tubulinosema ratisbonensis]|uniref:Ribosomal S15 n=1 Tax=Tubulinosema ratisbonensis TaxID=291195 RepID=A0A437AKL5_9MICR|nr:ribosomal S15 [Tubulinosema ratisbonensis]